ncbi:MAG: acyltransferase [Acidobacteriaceae bacterium]|nr:acyltransferase [Acidobacteriaceae bacterium]
MSAIDRLIVKVKRSNTPLYRFASSIARMLYRPQAPLLPRVLKPLLRSFYEFHYLVIQISRLLITIFYRHPLFQGRCASMGENVSIDGLPFVTGHVEIHIGNNVWLGGRLDILSGGFLEKPMLMIKDGAELGWNVRITINREIVIEENARVSSDCRISDTDGHPREADLRARNMPVHPRDIRPVRICRDAWIGNGSHIMKGVTIGQGAIIGANSVVISDIPPYCLALGNPAEVYFKNYGRPSKKTEGTGGV